MILAIKDAFRTSIREDVGTGACKILRNTGIVPAIIYGDKKENFNFAVDERDIVKRLDHANFFSSLFELQLNGKKELALVKDVQFNSLTDRPIHIDFLRVSSNTKTNVHVPISFVNENICQGIKAGGILNVVLHSLEVTCSVADIPQEIILDLANLKIGESIHTEDLDLGDKAQAAHLERDITIATIIKPSGTAVEEEDVAPEAVEEPKDDKKQAADSKK